MFRKLFTMTLVGTFAAVAAGASANPGTYDTAFEFSGNGGPINDFSVEWFSAQPSSGTVNPAYANLNPNGSTPANFPINGASIDPNMRIILELQITGLEHTSPSDLNIYLLDPFGTGIQIMDNRGDSNDFTGTLFFRDPNEAKPLPIDPAPLVDGSVYGPEAVGTGGKDPYFSGYQTTGNNEWRLVVIDDSMGDQGSFRSFTIRGLVVPEPATLSLLGIGGIVLLRRRKKA